MNPVIFSTAGYADIKGTPTVDLGVALYVIATTFWDPFEKSAQPAPPHYWALYQTEDPSVIYSSGPSDENGVCQLSSPKEGLADGEYALAFYPLPDDVRSSYMSTKEAWIDLTKNAWVRPPLAEPCIDRRKLVWMPAWSTVRQAKRVTAGFADAPPKASDYFKKTGRLKSEEIEPYGTVPKPWAIQLDYGWLHARVRYYFIDWKAGKEETLPPGLIVRATDDDGQVVGAGAAIDDADGTAYVLIAQNKTKWDALNLGFRAPKNTRVDLSAPAATPDVRLTCDGTTPPDRTTRNTLPNQWHSLGMQGRYASSASGTLGNPKAWEDLRKDIARDDPTAPLVAFHLDDVVLWGQGSVVSVDKGSRITMFDHLLAIRDPDGNKPYLSKLAIDSPYFRARQVFAVDVAAPKEPTTVRDLSTRLVNMQGTFYDIEEKRIVGTFGKTKMLGARAAVAGDHPKADYSSGCSYLDGSGRYELHYIPVPGVKDPATKLQLGHLLHYIGSKLVIRGDATAAEFSLYKNLDYASIRWSQGHPGVTQPAASNPSKDYQIVPVDASQRGKDVVRIRAFFGERTDGKESFTIQLTFDSTGTARSFVQGSTMTYYTSACAKDAATPASTAVVTDVDGSRSYWHTLSHEFGHVSGLPDEYTESLFGTDLDPVLGKLLPANNPWMPSFKQYPGWKSDTRPYWSDTLAMMRGNKLHRLRHVWAHAHAFSQDPAFASLPNHPHLVRNAAFPGGGMDYRTPQNDAGNPYSPALTASMLGGRADLTLFPVGEDEGLAGTMFSNSARPAGSRFDALLVFRMRFGFTFDAKIALTDRWSAMNNFHQGFYDERYREKLRFQLVGGTQYSRIAIIFHAAFGYGSNTSGANFVFNVTSSDPVDPTKNPFISDPVPQSMTLGLPDIASPWPAVRAALALPAWVATPDGKGRAPNTSAPDAASLANLLSTVNSMINDGGGRTVQPL